MSQELKRLAVIIGNSDYQNLASVPNAVNDAEAVRETLLSLGFRVTLGINQERNEILNLFNLILDLWENEASEIVFFYSGHGISLGGKTYIGPVDAETDTDFIDENYLEVEKIINVLLRRRKDDKHPIIIILDCCRIEAEKMRGYGQDPLPGDINTKMTNIAILYSTTDGQVASDGDDHSLYTKLLLENIKKGYTIIEIQGAITKSLSHSNQVPQLYHSLLEHYRFCLTKLYTELSVSSPIETLLEDLKKKRVDKEDAARAHWFFHRYIAPHPKTRTLAKQRSGEEEEEEEKEGKVEEVKEEEKDKEKKDEEEKEEKEEEKISKDPYEWLKDAIDRKAVSLIPFEELEKEEPAGHGTYGTVYKTKWKDNLVAVKEFVNSNDLIHDVKVFIVLGKHQNIIDFYGVTKDPDSEEYSIVMEYAALGNLHDFWDKPNVKDLPLLGLLNMALGTARGLQHIHKRGIIHRGLECGNVLLRENGSIALTGFSLAGVSTEATSRVTEFDDYHNIGSPIDYNNSDIYGLGILLWEIINKKRAFEDDYDPRLLDDIINGKRPPEEFEKGSDAPHDLPHDYISLYKSCWHLDRNEWPSISEVVERLEQCLDTIQDGDSNSERAESIWLQYASNNTTGREVYNKLINLGITALEFTKLTINLKKTKRGGFAIVHSGEYSKNEVAIKRQIKCIDDIIREVAILHKISCHPNIVEYFGFCSDEKYNSYIIMKYYPFSLHEYIRHREYKTKGSYHTMLIALDIVKGLEFLHAHEIIHCDMHSGNVLYNPKNEMNGKACLTDFGLSRNFEDAKKPEFRLKIYGRLGYLDPVLLRKGRPPLASRHDIYGMAVIFWEMMSRDNPNSREYGINRNIFNQAERCPDDFHNLYIDCKSSDNRPSASVIVKRLEHILDKRQNSVETFMDVEEAEGFETDYMVPTCNFDNFDSVYGTQ